MSSNLYSVLRGTRKRITGSRPAASLVACSEGVKFAQVLRSEAFPHELVVLHVLLLILLAYNNTYTHDCYLIIDQSMVGKFLYVLIDDMDHILPDER